MRPTKWRQLPRLTSVYSAPAHMQTKEVVLVSISPLVTPSLICLYLRGGTSSAATSCVLFAFPPPTTGLMVKIAHSNGRFRVNVAQRKAIIRCYAQTAPHTPSFQLPDLLIRMVTRVVNPRRVVNLRKKPLRAPSNPHCLKSPLITVIILHIQREALTWQSFPTDYSSFYTLFIPYPKMLLILCLEPSVRNTYTMSGLNVQLYYSVVWRLMLTSKTNWFPVSRSVITGTR